MKRFRSAEKKGSVKRELWATKRRKRDGTCIKNVKTMTYTRTNWIGNRLKGEHTFISTKAKRWRNNEIHLRVQRESRWNATQFRFVHPEVLEIVFVMRSMKCFGTCKNHKDKSQFWGTWMKYKCRSIDSFATLFFSQKLPHYIINRSLIILLFQKTHQLYIYAHKSNSCIVWN